MKQDIFINCTPQESRIAIVEDSSLAEFLVERKQERGIAGNIYKGKVARVLPGMQAAFVEIGMDKAAFLHVSDFSTAYEAAAPPPGSEDEIIFEGPKPSSHRRLPIERQLVRGQEILVQVAKDPIGMKGARITSHISLPGRYLVFMPTSTHVGISRRIDDDKERKRLKEIALSCLTKEGGFILRTACEGRSILDFVGNFMPRFKPKITLYTQTEPIMDHYGVEEKITKALERKVWLHSGGYITIERTEALTAIDVNTGRFVGKRSQEETIFKTNQEATQEIVHQLRLRNIGGIIIIDFIDMEKEANRKKVYEALREAIKRDKARTNILKISELGLVEMTRQRTRESLENMLLGPCPYCEGRGRIKSHITVAYEILRAIKREKTHLEDGKRIVVRLHPEVANFLYDEESRGLDHLEREINHKIIIKAAENLHHDKYEISTI